MSQGSRGLSLKVSDKTAVKLLPGLRFHLKTWLRGDPRLSCNVSSHVALGRSWWSEGPNSLLAVGWRPLPVPHHANLSTGLPHDMGPGFPPWLEQWGGESPRWKPQSLYNLTLVKWHFITLAKFCLFEASFPAQPTLKGRVLHKGVKSRSWGAWGLLHLRSFLLQCVTPRTESGTQILRW